MNIAGRALVIGGILSLALFGLSYFVAQRGLTDLSYLLYWPGWCLGMLFPCDKVGLTYLRECEVTFWHIAAFYGGLPLGALIYALPAYALLRLRRSASGSSLTG